MNENSFYEKLLNLAGVGVFSYTLDEGKILFANKGFAGIVEIEKDPKDLKGHALSEFVEYIEETPDILGHMDRRGIVHALAFRLRTGNGKEKWVLQNSFVTTDPKTGKRVVEAVVEDITERKNFAKKLAKYNENLEHIIADRTQKLEWANMDLRNEIEERISAQKRQKVISEVLESINKSGARPHAIHYILEQIKEFGGFEGVAIRLKDGEDYPYYESDGFSVKHIEESKSIRVEGEDGVPFLECMCGRVISGDVDHTSSFFTDNGSFWTNNLPGTIGEYSKLEKGLFTRGHCIEAGYHAMAIIPVRCEGEIIGAIMIIDEREDMFGDGDIALFEKISDSVGIAIGRKRTEEEVSDLARFPAENPLPVLRVGKDGFVFYTNDAGRFVLGAWGTEVAGHVPGKWIDLIGKAMDSGKVVTGEEEIEGKFFVFTIAPISRNSYANIYGVDISELKKAMRDLENAQDHLVHSEKMAVIGQLAAGIVHEVNNPLGYISSNLNTLAKFIKRVTLAKDMFHGIAEDWDRGDTRKAGKGILALKGMEEDDKMKSAFDDMGELLSETRDGIDRIKKITDDLKVFAHKDDKTMMPKDLNGIFDRAVNVTWTQMKNKVELKKDYGDIPFVMCNPQRIGQVFVNLLLNAAYAIENKGEITIRTRHDEEYVYAEVEDSGRGMTDTTKKRIFDPFFTTKKIGEGTGLGLSISYDIVKKHGGEIEISTYSDKGTKVVVRLPVGKEKK